MGENYYYMWEFVTSVTIIILVAAYIAHDRLRLKFEKLDDAEKDLKLNRLGSMTRLILGVFASLGSIGWIVYMQTHTIFISPELEGFHNLVPPIIMGIIGLILLATGLKNYSQTGSETK
jgi:hypothetical protein